MKAPKLRAGSNSVRNRAVGPVDPVFASEIRTYAATCEACYGRLLMQLCRTPEGSRLVVLKRSLTFSLLVDPVKWGTAEAGDVAQAGAVSSPLGYGCVTSGPDDATCVITIGDDDVLALQTLRTAQLGPIEAPLCFPNCFTPRRTPLSPTATCAGPASDVAPQSPAPVQIGGLFADQAMSLVASDIASRLNVEISVTRTDVYPNPKGAFFPVLMTRRYRCSHVRRTVQTRLPDNYVKKVRRTRQVWISAPTRQAPRLKSYISETGCVQESMGSNKSPCACC